MKEILLLMFLSVSTYAVEPIKGAFGFYLGDKFDPPASMIKRGGPLNVEVTVDAKNRNASFDSYTVSLTFTTHLIYAITAHGKTFPSEAGREAQNKLLSILINKYGPLAPRREDDPPDQHCIIRGDKWIVLTTKPEDTWLAYSDNALAAQCMKEYEESQIKKVEDKGL